MHWINSSTKLAKIARKGNRHDWFSNYWNRCREPMERLATIAVDARDGPEVQLDLRRGFVGHCVGDLLACILIEPAD